MSESLANIRQQSAVLEAVAGYAGGDGNQAVEDAAELLRSVLVLCLWESAVHGTRQPAALYLSDGGVDARVLDASEALYYQRITPNSSVVLVSRSGRTAEVVRVAEQMRRSAVPFVAVTNEAQSPYLPARR